MPKPRRRAPSGQKPNAGFLNFAERIAGKEIPLEKVVKSVGEMEKAQFDIKQSLQDRKAAWNRKAVRFPEIVLRRELEAASKILKNDCAIRPNNKIVSVGSGSALLECFIARELVPQGRITCVDFAHEMNKLAKQTIAKSGVRNVSLTTGYAHSLPFASASQDKVLAIGITLGTGEEWDSFLKEAHRVLKKEANSRIIITTPLINREELYDFEADLKENHLEPVFAKHYFTLVGVPFVMLAARPV